jgi:hypothetical protein
MIKGSFAATIAVMKGKQYDKGAIIGMVIVFAGMVLALSDQLDALPPSMAPWIKVIAPYATMFMTMAGAWKAAQSPPPLVPEEASEPVEETGA